MCRPQSAYPARCCATSTKTCFGRFLYNCIGIPIAAGALIPIFGLQLNPMFGAAAMSLSSFCVVMNALRLNLFHMHAAKRDTKRKKRSPMPEFLSGFQEKQMPGLCAGKNWR